MLTLKELPIELRQRIYAFMFTETRCFRMAMLAKDPIITFATPKSQALLYCDTETRREALPIFWAQVQLSSPVSILHQNYIRGFQSTVRRGLQSLELSIKAEHWQRSKSHVYDICLFFPELRRLRLNIRLVRTEHPDLQAIDVPDSQEIVDGHHDVALIDHTLTRLLDQRAHSTGREVTRRVTGILHFNVDLYVDGVVGGQRKLLLQTMARHLAEEESFVPSSYGF